MAGERSPRPAFPSPAFPPSPRNAQDAHSPPWDADLISGDRGWPVHDPSKPTPSKKSGMAILKTRTPIADGGGAIAPSRLSVSRLSSIAPKRPRRPFASLGRGSHLRRSRTAGPRPFQTDAVQKKRNGDPKNANADRGWRGSDRPVPPFRLPPFLHRPETPKTPIRLLGTRISSPAIADGRSTTLPNRRRPKKAEWRS